MINNQSSGRSANRNGRTLENTVIHTFVDKGFQVVFYREWHQNPNRYGAELLLRNVPYTTIYGQDGKTEFLVRSQRYQLNMRLECKWQQTSGSVDEKFPYVYLNAIAAMPEPQIALLIDGGGAKPNALRWLKNAVSQRLYESYHASNSPKTIWVWSLTEFLAWANRTLI
ncbi:PD-(D/E)XK nuclease superfamily protein [Sulfobacillus thermosulfidooxidans]|uniref:PD-(D/E)XK nuclease superfamily protein n=1 Tax=Sulfobacillus thermosulfidooxidans TaxID=28034 RepID=UPI00048F80EB|nr:PD-(D/E)XK nuclease superfamily protein [Sulfobacillus thermosulfidooxidans]